jgi:Golgi phosphoprotein 3
MDSSPNSPIEPKIKSSTRSHHKKSEKKMPNLNVPEKLFILSIDDDQGALVKSVKTMLRYGLAGALLAELALANKINLEEGRLASTDVTSTGDAMVDEALEMIAAEQKPRKTSRWIDAIGKKLTFKQTAERLSKDGVFQIEKKRYLWVIPYEASPQVDASAKYWVKQHLRGIVLAGEKAEAADVALLSLLRACRLLHLVFTHDERKMAEKKVGDLVQNEVFGEAVVTLLAEIDAATSAASS